MKWSINAGRIFGIKLRIHVTFFLLLLIVFSSALSEQGLKVAVLSSLFICAIFACVVIHEVGHSLIARRFGRVPSSITLLPIGGVAAIDRMPTRPTQEIAISLVGPLINLVIAGLLYLLFGRQTGAAVPRSPLSSADVFVSHLIGANIVLAVFNLTPALPMDGGRVLRGLLALKMGHLRATLLAATVGKVIAVLFILLGLRYNFWLVLIGFFIYAGASSERQQALMQAMFAEMPRTGPPFSDMGYNDGTTRWPPPEGEWPLN
jgi:Zn-dependent protease